MNNNIINANNNNDNGNNNGISLMEQLLNSAAAQPRSFNVGDIIEAYYIGSGLVDIGAKADALLDPKELKNAPNRGSACKVLVVSNGADVDSDEDFDLLSRAQREQKGMVVVSVVRAEGWAKVQEAATSGTNVTATIIGRQLKKGGILAGLKVRCGALSGFIPRSQLKAIPADELIGKTVDLKVEEADHRERKLIFNLAPVIAEREAARQAHIATQLETIAIGTTLTGKVTKVLEFGALVDIGNGVCGLVHRTEMLRGAKPEAGATIHVLVIGKDAERGRISLSQKGAARAAFAAKATAGYAVESAPVVAVQHYGAFVELEPGVCGLLHKSRLPRNNEIKVGDRLNVRVLSLDDKAERIDIELAA